MKYRDLNKRAQQKIMRTYKEHIFPDGWDKYTSDRWKSYLGHKGFMVTIFHYQGFHKKGNGASFEAEINLARFMAKENMKKMILAGIDIMLIRRLRQNFASHLIEETSPNPGFSTWRYRARALNLPQFKVYRKQNAKTFNPQCMAVQWDGVDVSSSGLDAYTANNLGAYILKRAKSYAVLYYKNLKKEYDKRISLPAMEQMLSGLGMDFDKHGDSNT
jgi:hypothetical protein